MLLTFALQAASLALFAVFARSLSTWGEILALPYADPAGFGILVFAAVLMLWVVWLIRPRRRAADWCDKKWD
jgi:hypothetical protein